MSFRNNIFVQIGVPIPYTNKFVLGRSKKLGENTFMANRQKPYQGWHDRRCGWYNMSHNKHNRLEE